MWKFSWVSSLRSRILMVIVGLVVLGMGSLGLLAARQIATSEMQNFTNRIQSNATVLAGALVEPFEYGLTSNAVATIVDRYAQAANIRITLVDAAGRAVVDSSGRLPSGNLLQDPEFAEASPMTLAADRRVDELGAEHIWTAASVVYENSTLGYVRVAASTSETRETIRQRLLALAGAFLLLLLLSILLGSWLTRSLTRPLQKLRDTALMLADGDLSQRVPPMETDEMQTVGQAFNEMADQVQSMVAEQRAFAGNAAHELRTPITAIRLRTERMLGGKLDQEETQEYIAEIDSEATRMGGLVDDLTLLSRLDANRLQVGEAQVDIGRVAASLLQDLLPRAEKQGIALTLENPSGLPQVTATINHVQVVLRNLLDNALKYTPSGGQVRCRIEKHERHIRITVVDNGQGIDATDLPHISQRFYRADRAHTRQIEGVGLGLSLVSSLLAAYEGSLQIESDGVDEGTIAIVMWPV